MKLVAAQDPEMDLAIEIVEKARRAKRIMKAKEHSEEAYTQEIVIAHENGRREMLDEIIDKAFGICGGLVFLGVIVGVMITWFCG